MQLVGKLIAAIIFAIVGVVALSPLLAMAGTTAGPVVVIGTWLVLAVIIFVAPTVRRSFGRGFLLSGAALLALPLSTFMLSGQVMVEMMNDAALAGATDGDMAATAIGATAGAAMLTGVAAMFGVILGIIFLAIGFVLALGGRREVVVVERG